MPPCGAEGALRACQGALVEDLGRKRTRTPEERAAVFRQPPRGSVEDRWSIYAVGYVTRIAEALENDYPAVRRIVGEGPFRSLAARYAAACPPRSFDLGRAGDRLAGFLEDDPLAERLPFLPDLARLEWAVAEAFVALDAASLTWADLQALGPEAAADLRLALRPGTALLRSRWPLRDLWALRERPDEGVSLQVEGRPASTVLVHRKGFDVRCQDLDDDDARLAEALASHPSLAALEAAGLFESDLSPLIERFRRLVDEGVFSKEDTCRRPRTEGS